MKFDLTEIMTNIVDVININKEVVIPDSLIESSNIKKLENVYFKGRIFRDYETSLILEGIITGTMILPDDITLEDTKIDFESDIEEYIEETLKITKNTIDILDLLWQNILVEIPLRIRNEENANIHLEGDGWRLITEEELNNRKNTPFSDLSIILEKGGK